MQEFYNQNESQLLVVDDETRVAKGLVNNLQVAKLLGQVTILDSMDTNSTLDYLGSGNFTRVCIIDINFGVGKDKDGIDIIKYIKEKVGEHSLIIAYSGNISYKDESIRAGADKFFLKDITNPSRVHREMDLFIKKFLTDKLKLVSYYAEIAHIDEDNGWVKLDCYYDDQIVEKEFEIEPIRSAVGELLIDKVIKIYILQDGSEIRINFFESDKELHDDIEIKTNLMNSKIWTQKNE